MGKCIVNVLPVKSDVNTYFYYDSIVMLFDGTLSNRAVNFYEELPSQRSTYKILDGENVGTEGLISRAGDVFPSDNGNYHIRITRPENITELYGRYRFFASIDKLNLGLLKDNQLVKVQNIRFIGGITTSELSSIIQDVERLYCTDLLTGDIKDLGSLTKLTSIYVTNANGQNNNVYGDILDFVKEQFRNGRVEISVNNPIVFMYPYGLKFNDVDISSAYNTLENLSWSATDDVVSVLYESSDHLKQKTATFNISDL